MIWLAKIVWKDVIAYAENIERDVGMGVFMVLAGFHWLI
jgi:hypothetical protein